MQSKKKELPLVEVRCANPECNRLLVKARGDVVADCRRCKGRTIFYYDSGKSRFIDRAEKL